MDWPEINCLLEALDALIEKYQASLADSTLSEDDRSDLSNDLSYAQILRGKYKGIQANLAAA